MCYEAGVMGYEFTCFLKTPGVKCMVVAPSRIPEVSESKGRMGRGDSLRLAGLPRAEVECHVVCPVEIECGGNSGWYVGARPMRSENRSSSQSLVR